MTLASDQALLLRAITWPTGVADFLAQSDEPTRAAFARVFADTPAFDRVARVGVYAEGYFWRLHGVLADHFGLVAWLCGPARFRNLVTDYVLACPSIDPDIRRYGERFPGFVATHPEGARVLGLADVAAIEWAMVCALDAPDERVRTEVELRAVPLAEFPALELRAVATARVLPCALPFTRLHARVRDPSSAPSRPIDVLVWRAGLDVVHRELDAPEADAVRALVAGVRFAELCDRATSAELVVAWLHRWLTDGLIAA